MNHSPTIYISHHSLDVEKAKEIANALLQIEYICEECVNYLETILPGSHISGDIFEKIKKADLIIVLPSSAYLAKCKDEISWIKSSMSYKKRKVLPIPFPNSLWKDAFPDIMPLPRASWFENIPFGENLLFKIVNDVKTILKNSESTGNRYMPLMIARADSNSNEYSQEFPQNNYEITLKHNEILVPIQGNSMSPRFEDGDLVICLPIDLEDILAAKESKKRPYVIRTKRQGTLLKYIKDINKQNITLASENISHPDIILEGTEIDSIFSFIKKYKN